MTELLVELEQEPERIATAGKRDPLAEVVLRRVQDALTGSFPPLEARHDSTQRIVEVIRQYKGQVTLPDRQYPNGRMVKISIGDEEGLKTAVNILQSSASIRMVMPASGSWPSPAL